MLTGYDIIGDVHGYHDVLENLLHKMQYTCEDGVYRHPHRKAIFVGDLVDRGPKIRETVELVRRMVEHEQALMVMGNHEFNAIAFYTEDGKGGHLRKRNNDHIRGFAKTIAGYADHPEQWERDMAWMKNLPLFLDLGGLRVVHAMWHEPHITHLKEAFGGKLTDDLLHRSHQKEMVEYALIEDTLKGREVPLPEGLEFRDKEQIQRKHARVCWWKNPEHTAPENYLIHMNQPFPEGHRLAYIPHEAYPEGAAPVFFGHYWFRDTRPSILAHNVVCLDYSVALGGFLCAYRWDGEQRLDNGKFVISS
jgi:hypothetical protein